MDDGALQHRCWEARRDIDMRPGERNYIMAIHDGFSPGHIKAAGASDRHANGPKYSSSCLAADARGFVIDAISCGRV